MSLAGVIDSQRTCSGLAYSGVNSREPNCVMASVCSVWRIIEELGDAEIEQLRRAVGRDQDVLRLEVAMHDANRCAVVHGRADLEEHPQALLQLEPRRSQYASMGSPGTYSMTI